jgi:DNA-binding response OmpR family regulator
MPDHPGTTMQAPTILIIDDEQELCLLLEAFLSKKSKAIDSCHTLASGFEKFIQMSPDLLILDHNLPDGLGIDYISRFKAAKANIQIVLISAMSNLRNEALEKGADHFIEKPISFGQLNKILSS